MVTTQWLTLTLLDRIQKDVNEGISCCSKSLSHGKRRSIVKIRRQVFSLLSSHVPLCWLLSEHTHTHIFGWMPFMAHVTEKYTSISPDCCRLLCSYHAIVTVTLVELMDLIGVCLPSTIHLITLLLCIGLELHVLYFLCNL